MNILLIGKPGAGKGTITQLLKKEGEFIQLSTGDLLREEIATGSELGKEIDVLLKKGNFATDETIFKIVNDFLKKNEGKSIIFDGFPRNVVQAKACLEKGIVFDKVYYVEADDDLVKQRIVNRRVHPPSGRVYNILTMPPLIEGKDDLTGEDLVLRNDDRVEVIDSRLKNFNELTFPIVSFLKENSINVIEINGHSPKEEQVKVVLNSLVKKRKIHL